MDVLILGLSNIVQRRVLPALGTLGVERIDVATRKAVDPAVRRGWTHGRIFESYSAALSQSDAPVVYVSLVNSEHESWIEQGLRAGRHVVVDKPAALGCAAAERLLDLADRQGRCLAEATVFGYHPQVEAIRQLFAHAESPPTQIGAFFSFPPLDALNFRYQKALGGGALWDVGPYAAAIGRVFFGAEPQTVACEVLQGQGADSVETAFSILCTFSEGRSLFGHFGFDTIYRNRLDLVGPRLGVQVDRIFTTPPELSNSLHLTRGDESSEQPVPAGDAFATFLAHVFGSIERDDWTSLALDLHSDARTLQRLRDLAGLSTP